MARTKSEVIKGSHLIKANLEAFYPLKWHLNAPKDDIL